MWGNLRAWEFTLKMSQMCEAPQPVLGQHGGTVVKQLSFWEENYAHAVEYNKGSKRTNKNYIGTRGFNCKLIVIYSYIII